MWDAKERKEYVIKKKKLSSSDYNDYFLKRLLVKGEN